MTVLVVEILKKERLKDKFYLLSFWKKSGITKMKFSVSRELSFLIIHDQHFIRQLVSP